MSRNLSTKNWSAKLLAGWKYLLSFRKSDWELDDYPVVVRKQEDGGAAPFAALNDPVQFTMPAYVARVVNWTALDGFGGTRAEALAHLRKRFANACAKRSSKPRPGTDVPLEFAPQGRIAARQALADEFARDVLGVEDAWLSDESCLWHFALGGSLEEYYAKIMLLYGVDVRDVPNGNIAAILDRIAAVDLRTRPDRS
jgi:hypothetical protein